MTLVAAPPRCATPVGNGDFRPEGGRTRNFNKIL